ncbi:MAG TPA: hydantoinase B/oxoprolinase family protein, partial [Casimicrobiaceae bacterium]|nr:hydantoinase B/oxoprolinase family protein [Casimicrobiaceae bacterium]
GYLRIAVENMAHAIKHISVERGYDVTEYTLCCFGGAGGQHACAVADALGITRVFIHPLAGVLSAYGMGLADVRALRQRAVEARMSAQTLRECQTTFGELAAIARGEVEGQGIAAGRISLKYALQLKYDGTDTTLEIPVDSEFVPGESVGAWLVAEFERRYQTHYGFLMPGRALVIEAVTAEAIGAAVTVGEAAQAFAARGGALKPAKVNRVFTGGAWQEAPVYARDDLRPGDRIAGPAVIAERNATTVIDPGWAATLSPRDHLILERAVPLERGHAIGTTADPVLLEVFNNLFMAIAEQMGVTLANTAYSVNIKERLDFSCALFDAEGNLIANAPHMPVHLGSMGESVKTIIERRSATMQPGDAFVLNAPYNGGTHLPDVTVITPVFLDEGVGKEPLSPGERGGGEGRPAEVAHNRPLPEDLVARARSLRQGQTDAEALLWSLLRNGALAGKKFRGQHPLLIDGKQYVADFYCHERGLVIELDGGQHVDQASYDEGRTRALGSRGIRVIRFWDNEVLQQTEDVLEAIWRALVELPSPPTPLPEGEGSRARRATRPEFFVASRGHHADIGGITPGSMPPASTHVDEEGVLLDNVQLVGRGRFLNDELRAILTSGRYPCRNVEQNLADLRAQVAACARGIEELKKMVAHFGLPVVRAYMKHVQDNAEEAVRRVLDVLKDGHFEYEMDSGARIAVRIAIDKPRREATIDFSGTSPQQPTNFNAPSAVCKAAVLYVFRTLVDDEIPMNAGCLKPLKIVIPEGSMLSPRYPAAVVAGNVETSQSITDTLYGALGVLAASQGTMNNFTFGNDVYQYYETVSGGSGAGPGFDGASVVQSHMTNSRLTDPEVLEWRFPVRLESYRIRHGSGGAGRHRGGDGGERRVRFLEAMTAVMLANHRRIAPFGVAGGQPGAVGRNWVERVDGSREEYGATCQVEMQPGDVFVIQTPGGGGYGTPEILPAKSVA